MKFHQDLKKHKNLRQKTILKTNLIESKINQIEKKKTKKDSQGIVTLLTIMKFFDNSVLVANKLK